jgi:hypothetical protein
MTEQEKIRKQQIEAWLEAKAQDQSAARFKKRPSEDAPLSITSLMDAVTIILIFLLMNFSSDPMQVTPRKEVLELPLSTSKLSVKEKTITITIAADSILVDDKKAASVQNNKVDSSTPNSLLIEPLKAQLDEVVENTKRLNGKTGAAFKDVVTLIVHGGIHYRLVTEVLYTAGTASFTKFKFAVVKGGRLSQAL